ncbi:MAG: zinc-ribbon domain-containing protein [Lachnospiraceae bacterium]
MYCRKCGQEIGQEEAFCSNCGVKAELVKQPKEPKKKSGGKIF